MVFPEVPGISLAVKLKGGKELFVDEDGFIPDITGQCRLLLEIAVEKRTPTIYVFDVSDRDGFPILPCLPSLKDERTRVFVKEIRVIRQKSEPKVLITYPNRNNLRVFVGRSDGASVYTVAVPSQGGNFFLTVEESFVFRMEGFELVTDRPWPSLFNYTRIWMSPFGDFKIVIREKKPPKIEKGAIVAWFDSRKGVGGAWARIDNRVQLTKVYWNEIIRDSRRKFLVSSEKVKYRSYRQILYDSEMRYELRGVSVV